MKTPTIKRGSRSNHSPEYDDATKAKLIRFLVAYLTEAEITRDQTIAAAGDDRDMPIYANKIKYHEAQISTIKWLIYKVHCRQRHLLEMDDAEIEEALKKCVEQSRT